MYDTAVRATTSDTTNDSPNDSTNDSTHATTTDSPNRHTGSESESIAVQATGLGKRYGDLWALRDVDLAVPAGTVLGMLGHNGAGKTTAIRILTTLAVATEGSASVAGYDVATEPDAVRRSIGVAAQQATVDGLLSARRNLVMVGRLHGLAKRVAGRKADELLERFNLEDAADRLAKNLSGGMRRRLDLAASLVDDPTVLFLDEPTTGLDPRGRGDLWDVLRDLVRAGTTILLTTQYLDEADRLADDVVVLDHGRTIAHGTPAELKARIGGDRVEVVVPTWSELSAVVEATRRFATQTASIDEPKLTVTVPIAANARLMDVMRALDHAGVDAVDINRRQATLDDVFLTLTDPGADRPTGDEREREEMFV
jgi:ABC-2 type transport system ATP-binding protein